MMNWETKWQIAIKLLPKTWQKLDSTDAQIKAWVDLLNQAPDRKTQQRAKERLKLLGVNISITKEGKINVTRKKRV